MPKAPVPEVFPGDFFVLAWDRDIESFRLELDDETHSSYDLGANPIEVARLLLLRGFEKTFREQAVDIAREFGIAQCIPASQRVLPIIERQVPAPRFTYEEENSREWTPDL